MEQFGSLLDNIPQRNHDYYDDWANGARGSISDRNASFTYRFHKRDTWNKHIIGEVVLTEDEGAPIVAVGIVAYWLHYRKNPNLLAAWNIKQKTIPEIYKDYTEFRLNEYLQIYEQKPSCWRNDPRRDFFTHYIIPYEKRLIKQSEALLEYITPEDQQLVRDVMKEYIHYLQQIRDTYQPSILKPKQEKKPEEVRVVDIETIGNHFKRGFDKTTHLPTLKLFLEQPQSDKELARVALFIYNSQWFISGDYAVFSEWYKDFCRLVGCKFHESYEPNKLTPSEELKNKYYFLL